MSSKIYLDNNATTFCDPRVVLAMSDLLCQPLGNPSSVHTFGQRAKALLLNAQRTISSHVSCKPSSLVFTSGGTESVNYCIRGLANHFQSGHILTSNVEHSAVEATLTFLEGRGWRIERLKADERGCVPAGDFENALAHDTRFIVIIAANNETGVKSDLSGIAKVAERAGIPLVIDGVAWLGKERIPQLPGKVFWNFSAHKIHGPCGVGMTILPSGAKLEPLITGGPQQLGRRGGTENISGIIGLAAAIECLEDGFEGSLERMKGLRDRFESRLLSSLTNISINGLGDRVCNTSNIAFMGVDGETLLINLDQGGVAASMGSACSSGSVEPSRVLLNMGYPRERVVSSLRFSLSRFTTEEEVDAACDIIIRQCQRLVK